MQHKNIILLNLLVLISSLLTAFLGYWFLLQLSQSQEQRHQADKAEQFLNHTNAVRAYTASEIQPLTSHITDSDYFHPQSVPAYAATQVALQLTKTADFYRYKEAVFNPTNVRDKAAPWEERIIQEFIDDQELTKLTGTRIIDGQKSAYIAQPIRVSDPACLLCHSTPEAAPASLINKYGDKNGFGWKLGEIVGAQMVIMPIEQVEHSSLITSFWITVLSSIAVLLVLLNISWVFLKQR